jgi:hypothetical protein
VVNACKGGFDPDRVETLVTRAEQGEAVSAFAILAERKKVPRTTAVAPDEEINLLREFAGFIIGRARVSTDPKDHPEWKALLARVKQMLGAAS